jgi:hypothetical protein
MSFRQIVTAIIAGVWLLGFFLMATSGKNYTDETPTQRPIDKVLETSKPEYHIGYNNYDDPWSDPGSDFEPEEGITTP